MKNENTKHLKDLYRSMTTFGLVELYVQDGLAEDARPILEKELTNRGLSLDEIDWEYYERMAEELKLDLNDHIDSPRIQAVKAEQRNRSIIAGKVRAVLHLIFR